MEGDRDVGHADHTPADHHDDHRNNGFSGTAEDSGGTVGKCQEEIKQRIDPGLAGSTLDDFRCAVKGGDQMGNEKKHKDPHKFCQCDGTEYAEAGTFFDTVIFFCPDVLTGEGSNGKGKTGNREKSKALDLGIRATAGHSHFSERVDVGLYHHVSQGNDGILDAGRKTVGNDLPQHEEIQTDLFDGNPVLFRASQKLAKTENCTQSL